MLLVWLSISIFVSSYVLSLMKKEAFHKGLYKDIYIILEDILSKRKPLHY